MKLNILLLLIAFIIAVLISSGANGQVELTKFSYGEDIISGKTSPTEKPPETTTKKKGFFSGIKKFFRGDKSTTTEEPTTSTTTTTTAKPTTPKAVPSSTTTTTTTTTAKPNNNRDFVAKPSSPPSNTGSSTTSTTTTTTIKPNNNRDYVAPSRPQSPSGPQNFPTSTINPNFPNQGQRTPPPVPPKPTSPTSVRDYVASPIPTYGPTTKKVPPPVPPKPTTSPIDNRRVYVNPNVPTQSPKPQAPTVPPKPSSGSGSPNIFDDKDFPALGPSRGGPKPSAGTSTTTQKPGERVSFIPGRPTRPPAGGSPTHSSKTQLARDDELETLSETLLSKDTNNQNQFVTVNLQGKTKSIDRTDEAPDKLLDVKEQALNSPTISKMRPLFNNYEIDTSVNEHVTPIEHKEENDFIDAIMATTVMKEAMKFLQNKGVVTADPKTHRDYLKTLWFTLYSRGGGRIGSSAFEHVFLNEIKNGTVIGMHNWVYFHEEEKIGHIDYQGYIRKVDLGNKGSILKFRFKYNELDKYANTLFVGTSPELEMALYTVCFATRADQDCQLSLNQQKINIVTHTWKYRGKQLIGSAYPEI